jgi:hypothetical protein
MASEKAILDVLDLFASVPALHGQPLKPRTPEAYRAALEPVSDDLLKQAAVLVLRREESYFPTPGKLFQAALELVDDQPGAVEAWGMLIRSIPYFENLTVRIRRTVMALGGFQAISEMPSGGDASTRARFIQAYEDATRKERLAVLMLPPGSAGVLMLTESSE